MMKKYRVFVEGMNFLIEFDNKPSKYGFYTTRFVEAIDPTDAENKAMEMLRVELINVVLNEQTDSPIMLVEEIDELQSFGDVLIPGAGFSWFPEEKGH